MADEQAAPAKSEPFVQELELPSGGHVSFHHPEDLTGKAFKAVVKGLGNISVEDANLAMATGAIDTVACHLIKEWTIPYKPGKPREAAEEPWPLPSTDPDLLEELSITDYRAVLEHCGPAVVMLMPGEATPDDSDKPGYPTEPASD